MGQGYIYGAKGQVCSPAFREGQAAQYPEQAERILGEGAKWDGMPVWDCAQLTREAAKAGGVTLVSGATSQWTKTDWARCGLIGTMPEDEVVFLFRQSGTVMQHTGVGLGDGTAVHAKGTSYGVVHEALGRYAWTHWASPWPGGDEEEEVTAMDALYQAVVATQRDPLNVRDAPDGGKIGSVPKGATVDVLSEPAQGWTFVRSGSLLGYVSSAYLSRIEASESVEIGTGTAAEVVNSTTLMRDDGTCITLLGTWRVVED